MRKVPINESLSQTDQTQLYNAVFTTQTARILTTGRKWVYNNLERKRKGNIMSRVRCLNGNFLKIIAAICMVADHVGLMFFPHNMIFRIIGRIAFPIFAFMISEGARYTRNKLRYFLSLFTLSAVCQSVYYFFSYSLYMCVLVTFSLSLAVIFALSKFKKALFNENAGATKKVITLIGFILSVALVFVANHFLDIDYGIYGCFLPVFASLLDFRNVDAPESVKRLDTLTSRVLTFLLGMLIMAIGTYDSANSIYAIQPFMLLAAPLLLAYSGERGKIKMKYFFYVFYPLHLVVIEGVYILMYYILR